MTLVGGSALALEALALARAQGDAGQLGGGMMCFAGEAGGTGNVGCGCLGAC